jgi:PKD repeat protein
VTDKSTNSPDSWAWDWGDGTTDNGRTPAAHTYSKAGSYTVTLTATNSHGFTSSTIPVTVDPPAPVASFTVTPPSGNAPLNVSVTDTSTGSPTSWSWDFGDGSPVVTGQNSAVHQYLTAATYTIKLTAGTTGGSNATTRQVVVNPPPPTAGFTVSPGTGPAPLSVTVTDRSTGGPTSWDWNFGDGSAIASGRTPPAHVYTTPGSYTITLTARNAGGPSIATMPISVTVPKPTASFTATPLSGTAPLAVSVTDTSTGSPTGWSWTFGDGTAAVGGRTPGAHTYTAAGTYTITLTASNPGGSTTATRAITVNPVPTTRLKDITFDPTLTDLAHGADRTSGTITRDTTTPLAGAGSARIANTTSYVEESFTATDDLYGSFLVRLTATPSTNARLLLITNGGTAQGNLELLTTRRLRLRIGSTTVGVDSPTMTVGTTYIVGFHQRRGTGSNGMVEAWLAPAGSAFGSPFARRTTGTWTTAADRVRLGATDAIRVSVLMDNLLLDRASMPTTPAS